MQRDIVLDKFIHYCPFKPCHELKKNQVVKSVEFVAQEVGNGHSNRANIP